nr:uncharacterized protein LOC100176366 [Ciona intestinalis]|eukprot:XP_002124260.1 uncharacterized protein LOC100176366 [Ciona intestinalis]
MATVEVVGITATQLGELPGHQITTLDYTNVVPRHNNSIPTKSKKVAHSHANSHDVTQPDSSQSGSCSQSAIEDYDSESGSKVTTRSSSSSNLVSEISETLPKFSVGKDRLLLDNLIQLDEEEFDEVSNIPSVDQMYQQWKYESGSKKPPMCNNRNNRIPVTKQAVVKSTKPRKTLLSGWESGKQTLPQRAADKRQKPKANAFTVKSSKERNNLHDKYLPNTTSNDKFFHYTDIALYIKQYRREHCQYNTINLQANGYREQLDMNQCVRWEPKEMHFPLHLDLSSMIERSQQKHRLTSVSHFNLPDKFGQDACGEPCVNGTNYARPAVMKGSDHPSHQHHNITPVILRPPHQNKSPTNPRSISKVHDAPHARISGSICKAWKDDLRKTGTQINNVEVPAVKNQVRPCSKPSAEHEVAAKECSTLAQSTAVGPTYNTARCIHTAPEPTVHGDDVIRDSNKSEDDVTSAFKQNESTPYQINHKIFGNSRYLRSRSISPDIETTTALQKYYLRNDLEINTVVPKQLSSSKFKRKVEVTTQFTDATEKKEVRLKAQIAAEIHNLQQRRAMSNEQRQKLDNFRRALSNTTYHKKSTNSIAPPSEESSQNIASSIRALYARTTRTVSGSGRQAKQVNSTAFESLEDNQPIIFVKSSVPPNNEANENIPTNQTNIIGGVEREKSPACGSTDKKQFNRISELLRIKKRKEDKVVTIARVTSSGTTTVTRERARLRNKK